MTESESPVPVPPRRPARSEYLNIRGLNCHVRHWGPETAPKVFFLHGWMDSSATFQFVVDALQAQWHVIAPDWRGYGASQWLGHPYWFPDYYADLDAILKHFSPETPAQLVGHSMGGNIAATYAALRPARVRRLAMLDFLGLKPSAEQDAPTQIGAWLNALDEVPRLRAYADQAALARRLCVVNPRLTAARAAFLAEHVGRVRADGKVEMACDPWHKVPSPTVYRVEDTLACWQKIEIPVLMMVADQGYVCQRFGLQGGEFARRLSAFKSVEVCVIEDAGHNLQHDQPEAVAQALEAYLLAD